MKSDWSYEVCDTKLARQPKGSHVLQLCFYSDLLSDEPSDDELAFRALVGVLAFSGLQLGEAVGLRWMAASWEPQFEGFRGGRGPSRRGAPSSGAGSPKVSGWPRAAFATRSTAFRSQR